MSRKSNVTVEGSDIQHSFIISAKSPINLMERDLLCKLDATIQCTPDELFLTIPDDRTVQAVQFLQSTADCLYCWTLSDFQMLKNTVPNIQNIAKISPACAPLMSAMRPILHCHFLMHFLIHKIVYSASKFYCGSTGVRYTNSIEQLTKLTV